MNSSALARLPFLHGVPQTTIVAVKRVLRPMSVTAGTMLFRTGDEGDTCYLVESGALRVLTSPNGELLATVAPGAFVGELAVLLGEARSATVIADKDSKLLALSRRDLDALMTDHPALALAMSRELGRRILRTNQRLAADRAARRSIVWPASKVTDLAAAIAEDGRRVGVAAIAGGAISTPRDAVRVKAPRYGADDPRFDVVLIGMSDAPSSRATKIVDAADHVLCFGAPPPWLRGSPRAVRLNDDAAGMRRAVRWATGRAVGIALSSGGSKTVAHVGVIRVLRDAGIEVDAVAGTSGGALGALGVAFAMKDPLQDQCLDDLARATHWRRLDLNVPPRSGVWKGRRLREMFARWEVGPNLEDADVPVWLIASDVATGATVTLREGPVADAIRASMSIPGAFDPWRVGDKVLIDGAVANPLPTDVLREAGVGIVIASNVAGQATELEVEGRLPGLGQIMTRVLNTMERERIRGLLPLADVVIRPRVKASNTFDFGNNEGVIEAGAKAAAARVDDIRSLLAAASSVRD